MLEIKRVLVAVDHSDPSIRAAEVAAKIAQCCGGEIVLLTVVQYPDSPPAKVARAARDRYAEQPVALVADEAALGQLQLLGERLTNTTGVPVACVVEPGEPAESIRSFADHSGIDLIAMGHTGHSRLVSLALGSVARRVIDAATCPVLIVR